MRLKKIIIACLFMGFLSLAGCHYNQSDQERRPEGDVAPPPRDGNEAPAPSTNEGTIGDQGSDTTSDEVSEEPEDPTTVSFVSFGDWGTGGSNQRNVAAEIGRYCPTEGCEFILTLGDNFYIAGVSSTTDWQWTTKYHEVYDSLGLMFYASLGNHDTYGEIQPQIDYSYVAGSNWYMGGEEYSFTKPDASVPPLVEFFIINSTYPNFRTAAAQSWLDGAITASSATWKILVMHHPIYSNGDHGDDEAGNNEFLLPIICHRIDLVLSGHDHNFAHMRSGEDGCPIEQLVIGTGGAVVREIDETDLRAVSSVSTHGFGWFRVTRKQIVFRMVEAASTAVCSSPVCYTTTWQKP